MNILVIGGAGFIGCNVADYYLSNGESVAVFDNCSRKGTLNNIRWLQSRHKTRLNVIQGDIRFDLKELQLEIAKADVVFHLAAQVAVTTSVVNPREDFEINALGTLNVLEAARQAGNNPIILYASTNKVYGGLEHLRIMKGDRQYEYANLKEGVGEDAQLDFHSPYGCSKGAADQYVIDYARIYGMRTIVFRQSCIYGYRQFGVEDQGWIAHFTIAALLDRPLTIYGDGMQVRDVLFIDDLVQCYCAAIERIDTTLGNAYNIGGGPGNVMSVLGLVDYLEDIVGKKLKPRLSDWRPGDQRVFICNIKKAKEHFEWEPKVGVLDGVRRLAHWVRDNSSEFKQ